MLLAVGASFVECNASTDQNQTAPTVDMLVLALQWPFSVCTFLGREAGIACMSPPASFIVGGLWPSQESGHYPLCCLASPYALGTRNNSFALGRIVDLEPQLRRLWPDLSSRESATRLWKMQWDKHGTCSRFTVRGYFRKVLELARRFDFMRALSAEGIVASAQRRHTLSKVQRAVNYATGGSSVRLECRRTWQGTILTALHVCFDADGFRAVDCPFACKKRGDTCCHTGELIQIPYWSRESNIPPENATSATGPDGASGETDARGNGNYLAGQIAGILVVVAGIGVWLFKQFFELRNPPAGTLEVPYQRIA
jgi:ribonuclease I